jgi:hypothetical protein
MSDAPRRLLDDPTLSEALREDLSAARDGADVSYDEAEGLERLRATIGAGTGPGPGTGSGTGTGTALGGKALLVGGAAVAIAAAVVGIALQRSAPPATAPALRTAPSAASSEPVPAPAPAASDDLPTLSLSALPVESASPPSPKPSASVESAEDRLRAEMAQLAEVRAASGSNPARALALANDGHQKFKGGVFYQEREALAISALARLGRSAEARSRAQTFVRAFPRGPYTERVRAETGLTAPETTP